VSCSYIPACAVPPTKQRRPGYITERDSDDLSLPGGVEIGLGYRKLRPRTEDARPLPERLGHWDGHTDPDSQELGARGPPRVSAPPVSAVQRTTGPSGERGYGARCLCWARRAPSGSATRQRVVPTDRHSFVACQLTLLLLLLLLCCQRTIS